MEILPSPLNLRRSSAICAGSDRSAATISRGSSVVAEQLQNGLFRGFRLRSAGGAFAGEAEVADAALPGLRHSEIGFQEGAAAAGFRRGVGEHPLESFAGLFPALLVRFGEM